MAKHIGRSSLKFDTKISITETASVVGKKEGEGPLRDYFDKVLKDDLAGEKTWEKAESRFMENSINILLNKTNIKNEDIDYILAGDLLNQCSSSSCGIRNTNIPFFGLFGACSTFGEGICLGSVLIDGGGAKKIIASTSSHFCSAEKQFRFPLDLGNQRPQTSTWTVTGSGSLLLEKNDKAPYVTGITTGKIVDLGVTDQNNMGAAMAPAAADTLKQHFMDFNRKPDYYDLIITGDLGYVGSKLLVDLLKDEGYDISQNHRDCGIEIYDKEKQDTHSGGSGCACSAVTFSSYYYKALLEGKINKILFMPTGALMSPTSVQQGESISGICHSVVIENNCEVR